MKYIAMMLVFVGIASATAGTVIVQDDFNRPDGIIGNGWTTYHAGSSPDNNDIYISNGAVRTIGSPGLAGGIYRDDLTLGANMRFEFDFLTQTSSDGGFDISFNASPSNQVYNEPAQIRFLQYSGEREMNIIYQDADNEKIVIKQYTPGQQRYRTNVWHHLEGYIYDDFSSVIHVTYNNSGGPFTLSWTFDAPDSMLAAPPGIRLHFGNSSAFHGPYHYDNLIIESLAEPIPAPLAVVGGLTLMLMVYRRKVGR